MTFPSSSNFNSNKFKVGKSIKFEDLSVCYNCKSTGLDSLDQFCPSCSFPLKGTMEEQNRFIYRIKIKKGLLEQNQKAINKAQGILFLVAVFTIIGGIYFYNTDKDILALTVSIILAAVYILLGFWANKKPFPAILSGLIIYVTLVIFNAVLDPITLASGIIWKVLIISGFVSGYKAVKDAEKLTAELDEFTETKHFESSNDL